MRTSHASALTHTLSPLPPVRRIIRAFLIEEQKIVKKVRQWGLRVRVAHRCPRTRAN